jgi:hypothetical protein
MRWLVVIIIALTGCASYQSSFHPTHVDARELIWAYDNAFQVTQDGKLIAEQRDWDGLPGAVACVPRAREAADSAVSRDRRGKILTWSGVAVMLAGLATGAALVFHDTSNTDDVLLGGGVMIGGLLGGVVPVLTGMVSRARADTNAIDAVNIYNDERATCRRP